MLVPDFRVPTTPSDLESAAAGGWRVRKRETATGIQPRHLKDAVGRVRDDVHAFAKPDTFALAYSALSSFAELAAEARQGTCDLLATAVQEAAKLCKRASLPASSSSDDELADLRALLMASVYLLCWLVQEAESEQASSTLAASGLKAGAKKKTKKTAASAWSWDAHREDVALRLHEALELDLVALWSHRAPDEAFVLLFQRAALTIIEQPEALKSSTAALRDTLWRLLALPATRHEQAASTVSALTHLLLGREHIAPHLSEFCHHLEEHEAGKIVVDLFRELAALAPTQLSADTAGSKNVAAFLEHVAERGCPSVLIFNMDEVLHPHLNSERESLRCGAVTACGHLFTHAQTRAQEPEVAAAAASLLQILFDHLCDTSFYVRNRALQSLSLVCSLKKDDSEDSDQASEETFEGVLGIPLFLRAASLGLGRLIDKAALVRKASLQFLCTVIQNNPFGPSLNGPELIELRDELRMRLESRQAELPESGAAHVASEEATVSATMEDADALAGDADALAIAAQAEGTGDAPPTPALVPQTPEARRLEVVEQSILFEELLQSHLVSVMHLLSSQTTTDVVEAMQALVTCHEFGLQNARPARILTLVTSAQDTIKDKALKAAQSVYLQFTASRRGLTLEQAVNTCGELLSLVRHADLAELTSLEDTVPEWQRQALLPECLFTTLWDVVEGKHRRFSTASDRCGALALLNMAGAADGLLLGSKTDLLIHQVRIQEKLLAKQATKLDLVFVRHLCVALQRAADGTTSPDDAAGIAHAVVPFLVHDPPAAQLNVWFATAQQAFDVIFAFSCAPEQLCSCVLRRLGTAVAKADQADGVGCATLSRLLFCLGHVAIKMLAHIEACEKNLKKTSAQDGDDQASGRRGSRQGGSPAADAIAKEQGFDAAAAEEESEELFAMGNRMLEPEALLGAWAPLVAAACVDLDRFDADVRSSAVLTLCKFMCVSDSFCHNNLALLFTIMRDEPDHAIRANVAVALGDLALMHPNTLDHWKPNLYAQLRDRNACVRKNVLMVLSHLILNDNIRPMGQEAEIALRLLDEDARIASHARLFFIQYAQKTTSDSSLVYNQLPAMIFALSSDAALEPKDFREILKFLIGFVEKNKQTEDLVMKLCPKFVDSDDVRLHRHIAFCICSLTHSDKSVRKLQENFASFGNRLSDAEVYSYFTDLVARTRKSIAQQPELRPALDDFEKLLKASQSNTGPDEEGLAESPADLASHLAGQGADENVPPSQGQPEKRPAARAAQRGRRRGAA